jgi:hypothetical protein
VKSSEILYKAADLITQRGLARYELIDAEGQVCHNGAIIAARVGEVSEAAMWRGTAYGVQPDILRALRYSTTALQFRLATDIPPAPHEYSNASTTTAEDVILLLKEAAALAEERGD